MLEDRKEKAFYPDEQSEFDLSWTHIEKEAKHVAHPNISSLSIEVLTIILDKVVCIGSACSEDCVRLYNHKAATSLSLVCHRFNSIIRILEARSLQLEPWDPEMWPRELGRRISSDLSIRRFCRRLEIDTVATDMSVRDICFDTEKESIARKLFQTLPNVVCFRFNVYRPYNQDGTAWSLFQTAIRGFERMQHLSVSEQYLEPIVEACRNMPALKVLELREILRSNDAGFILDHKHHGTASLTTLRLVGFRETPDALFQLLKWPQALRRFEFEERLAEYSTSVPWTSQKVVVALLHHKESLRDIYLHLDAPEAHVNDAHLFGDFLCLENLVIDKKPPASIPGHVAAELRTVSVSPK